MRKYIILAILLSLLIFQLGFLNQLTFADAPIGNYIELHGGYLSAKTQKTDLPAAFSFEARIRPYTVSGVKTIVSIGNKLQDTLHFEIGINGGALSVRYYYYGPSVKLITAGSIEPDTWSHIAVVVDSTNTKLFVNGSQIFETDGANGLLPIGDRVFVGKTFFSQSQQSSAFEGDIDEFRISTNSRDIPLLWQQGVYDVSLVPDEGTYILWHFDQTRGDKKAVDSSKNGYHADLIGGDSSIHFFGVLPSPTQFVLPTISWRRPVLPTLSIPERNRQGTTTPTPAQEDQKQPSPTPYGRRSWNYQRPVFDRGR